MNKTVLITGGTRGVGKEIAKMFINRDYNVIITGRNKKAILKTTEELNNINYSNKLVKGYKLDYTDIVNSKELFNKLESKEIRPDFLINNAGTLHLENIDKINQKTLDIMFKVNVIGPLLLTKYCVDIIKKDTNHYSGILFNTPDYKIDDKTIYLLPYMQSKLAQTTLMKSIANLNNNNNAIVCGFWTNYPLLTDAILNKNIAKKDNCMHPNIVAKTLEELIFNTPNPTQYNSKVIIDKDFLLKKKVDINKYKIGDNIKNLDDLFLNHLSKINNITIKKNILK
tara:strand:+ start:558 stop:1406 length:849 start_codon:yes stop_codon:yes gene_type:complete